MATENKADYSPIGKEESDSLQMGSIEISSEVIAAIAEQAARKVEGVEVVSSSFELTGIFGGKKSGKGVAVKTDVESGHVEINVDVNVKYGVTIYEAAHDLQILIKEEVEALTGSMNVDKINVRVKHLIMPEDKSERELVPPDRAVGEEMAEEE